MATTKKDLIDHIAESTGTRRTLVKTVVQDFLGEIIAELARGNRLEFRDFGVFDTRTTRAGIAQNPRTLEKVEVPAKRRVVFKPGRLMREGVNGSLSGDAPATAAAPEQPKT
jgi:nucleoid DNA-binding protein